MLVIVSPPSFVELESTDRERVDRIVADGVRDATGCLQTSSRIMMHSDDARAIFAACTRRVDAVEAAVGFGLPLARAALQAVFDDPWARLEGSGG